MFGLFVCYWRDSPQWVSASSFTRFLDHTQRRTTVGRTPLDEWSARRIDLYLTTHNTHNRQTSMPPVGFEPSSRAAADLRFRPRSHWDRHCDIMNSMKNWRYLCLALSCIQRRYCRTESVKRVDIVWSNLILLSNIPVKKRIAPSVRT